MQHPVLDAIKRFEGFVPESQWDYAQHTNGYGTRALYAGEKIDRVEAERRFQSEIAEARSVVERHAPGLDEGTKAALTSLTFNAGTAWTTSGLGDAAARGDLAQVKEIFVEYNKAGGQVLPGLVSRRAAEAMWIGNPDLANAAGTGLAAATPAAMPPVVTEAVPAEPVPFLPSSKSAATAFEPSGARASPTATASRSEDQLFAALSARSGGVFSAEPASGLSLAGALASLDTAAVPDTLRLLAMQSGADLVAGADRGEPRNGATRKA